MPYRVEIPHAGDEALDALVELGALDVELRPGHGAAALFPDSITPERVAAALGVDAVSVTPATPRDAGSVWILSQRPVSVGRIRLVPAHMPAEPGAVRLIDAPAFGTGLHPSTALCLEALDEEVQTSTPRAVLDVGTGSGVLALAALTLGVPHATAVDIDEDALRVAEENARLNGLDDRLRLARGGPDAVSGAWPLVLANVLAAPLIEMAPQLVRRVAGQGRLVLSGIPVGLEHEVSEAYRRLGMRRVSVPSRSGWSALVLQASW